MMCQPLNRVGRSDSIFVCWKVQTRNLLHIQWFLNLFAIVTSALQVCIPGPLPLQLISTYPMKIVNATNPLVAKLDAWPMFVFLFLSNSYIISTSFFFLCFFFSVQKKKVHSLADRIQDCVSLTYIIGSKTCMQKKMMGNPGMWCRQDKAEVVDCG